jgi:hypothetical protein
MGIVVMHAVVSVDGFIAMSPSPPAISADRRSPLGLIDKVAMDVVPVVFGSGKRYFGAIEGQQLLEDPSIVIQGRRVLHLRYRVRR